MNLLTYNHTISSLFVLSARLYQKNIVPILVLTAVLIAPAFLIGFAGMSEFESIVFFLSVRVLEAGITLGIIGTAFGRFSPHLEYFVPFVQLCCWVPYMLPFCNTFSLLLV